MATSIKKQTPLINSFKQTLFDKIFVKVTLFGQFAAKHPSTPNHKAGSSRD